MGKKRKSGTGSSDKRVPELSGSESFAAAFGKQDAEVEPVVLKPAPARISSPFKDALGGLKKQLEAEAKQATLDKLKPKVPVAVKPIARKKRAEGELAEDEATALSLAMQGVKPLGGSRPGRVGTTTQRVQSRTAMTVPFGRSAEDEARARLDDLVAREVNFRIETDAGFVRAARTDAPARVVRELSRRTRASETLDLHGLNQREARDAVVAFVRGSHKRGLTFVCIVHGKGQHSEGGQGVLCDVAQRALTDSGAAQLVYAFCTAPEPLGGSGALLVELKH
jgi:DNA-nicking Smr family endonuclease